MKNVLNHRSPPLPQGVFGGSRHISAAVFFVAVSAAVSAYADEPAAPGAMTTTWGEKVTSENCWREYPRCLHAKTVYVDCKLGDYTGHDGSTPELALETLMEGYEKAVSGDTVEVATSQREFSRDPALLRRVRSRIGDAAEGKCSK